MKYLLFPIFFSLVFSSYVVGAVTGEDLQSERIVPTNSAILDLSLSVVKVIDDKHIRVVFTEAVDIESITLKLTKQTDNSTLRIATLTGVVDSPEAVDVILDDEMIESNSYSVTAIAAVGISGSTITNGALAIKDFSTPKPLKKYQVALNAPTNPNAVTIKPIDQYVKPKTEEAPKKEMPKQETPVPAEELPLTGMNPFFLIVMILPLVFFLVRRRAH